jgi:hypothetical protein
MTFLATISCPGGNPDVRRRSSCSRVDAELAGDPALLPPQLEEVLAHHYFGSAWAQVEVRSAILQRGRLRFASLPKEIGAAQVLLHRLTTPEMLAAN